MGAHRTLTADGGGPGAEIEINQRTQRDGILEDKRAANRADIGQLAIRRGGRKRMGEYPLNRLAQGVALYKSPVLLDQACREAHPQLRRVGEHRRVKSVRNPTGIKFQANEIVRGKMG